MKNFDDIFNEYFSDNDFGGKENKEKAKGIFNLIMNHFESNPDTIPNIISSDDEESMLLEEMFDKMKIESTKFFPIDSQEGIDLQKQLIEEHSLELNNLEVVRLGSNYLVSEDWTSPEKGYLMQQKYFLERNIFVQKSVKIQKEIIKELIKNNFFTDKELVFLGDLPKKVQMVFLKNLEKESVDSENYEQAAIYRDHINELK